MGTGNHMEKDERSQREIVEANLKCENKDEENRAKVGEIANCIEGGNRGRFMG